MAAMIMLVAGVCANFLPQTMTKPGYAADRWRTLLMSEMSSNLTLTLPVATTNEQVRFQEQVNHVSNRARHHFDVMQFFYLNHYLQLLLAAIFGALLAIALALLTKVGWTGATPYLISFFLTTSVCTAFFVAFPAVCKMDENVAKNKALYIRYVSLLNEARSYAAVTNYVQDARSTNTIAASDFILHLDKEMKSAHDIVVSFDPTKFPTYKVQEKP